LAYGTNVVISSTLNLISCIILKRYISGEMHHNSFLIYGEKG
jgi:hypothetical protein